MAKKPHDPEEYHPDAANFDAAFVRNIATGSRAKAEARSVEPLTEEESVLLVDVARRLRLTGFCLVEFAAKSLDASPVAVRYPGA